MQPINIIEKYYDSESESYRALIEHSNQVVEKSLFIAKKAKRFNPDLDFIEKAAMIHDIGIFLTDAPKIGCFGELPYVCHGYMGREIMEKEGFLNYGLVCERHVGMGITAKEIKQKKLPLPLRDMVPVTIEEEIVSLADKFFSKKSGKEEEVRSIEKEMDGYGFNHLYKFRELMSKLYKDF